MSNWITGNESYPATYLFETPDAVERCIIEDYDDGVAEVTLMSEYFPTEHYKFDIPNLKFNGKTNPDSAKETIDKMWDILLPYQRFMLIKSLGKLIIEPAEKPAVEGYPADYLYSTPDAVQRIDLVEFNNDVLKIALIHNNFAAEYHDVELPQLVFHDPSATASAKGVIDDMWGNMIPAQRLELIQSLGKRIVTGTVDNLIGAVQAGMDQMVNGDSAEQKTEDFEDALERAYWDFDAERKEGAYSERDIFKLKVRYLVNKY